MAESEFDLVVVGGGPGGYVAAIRAAQLGMKTAVVEREQLGGICLNWGCIPTKALLRSAEIYHLLHRLNDFGFSAKDISFDAGKVVARSRAVAKQLSNGVAYLLRKNKVTVFDGHGRLAGKGRLAVAKDGNPVAELAAEHIVIATGARARSLPGLEPDSEQVWTYKEAMVPPAIPKSLLVVGSGAIGIEFASFYHDMGAEVTVVEVLDRVLPVEDEEISAFARKAFEKQGIKIHTAATVAALERGGEGVTARIEADGKGFEANVERVILAVGIVGNLEDIGIENTGVVVDRTHIVVDEWLRTGEPGIYAIGDVVGPPWLAHKASHEGVICVEHIAGANDVHPLDVHNIPACTYCRPQVASIGLTEKAARDAGYEVKVGHFPFIANGKAIALGEPEGMVKTIFDSKTGELLGAHMIGETMHEAVLDAYGRVIHF
jgi:dihydrolipoamide dehydrogenase